MGFEAESLRSGGHCARGLRPRWRAMHVRFKPWATLRGAALSAARSHRPARVRRPVDTREFAASLQGPQPLARSPLFRNTAHPPASSSELSPPSSQPRSLPRITEGLVAGTNSSAARAKQSSRPPGLALLSRCAHRAARLAPERARGSAAARRVSSALRCARSAARLAPERARGSAAARRASSPPRCARSAARLAPERARSRPADCPEIRRAG